MAQVHDVAIVGAGPAGTSTAIELLQRKPDSSVLILEGIQRDNTMKPGEPGAGHSMCSGGLPTLLAERMIGWEVPRSVVMSDIRQAVMQTPGHEMRITPDFLGSDKPLGVITNRKKLDDWLLAWARKEGAHYEQHAQVVEARRNGHWQLRTRDGRTFAAKFLVGADGPESFVAAQHLGAPPIRDQDMYVASEVYVRAPKFLPETTLFRWQTSRIRGYYWSFSAGDVVKVGLCSTRASGVNPGRENDWWRAQLAEQFGEPGFEGKPLEHVGGRITCAKPLRTVTDGSRVAVVGEAARAVWAEIAAGDASAFETGRALGRALADGDPGGYQRWWRRKSHGIHMRHYRFKEMLLSFTDQELDRTLRVLSRFRPSGKDINRDALRFAGYALRKEPWLIGKAIWRAATA